jgi:hypothetical protein
MVVAAAFVAEFIALGTFYSSGIFYILWLEEFEAESGTTSWIGSICIGLICLLGKYFVFLMGPGAIFTKPSQPCGQSFVIGSQ